MTFRVYVALALSVVLFSAWGAPARAESHALLIGVTNYQDPELNLRGPVNDVVSLKGVLVRYGVPERNIATLTDAQATKRNILAALSDLRTRSRAGDTVFVYFSGHGTSGFDREVRLDQYIAPTSGAVVPYDFRFSPGNPKKTVEALILGSRDLRPVFQELDRDRKLFVAFDSCFSGNAVRSLAKVRIPGIAKFVPIDIPEEDAEFKAVKEEPFPYRNLLYFAAAHQSEKARDLDGQDGTLDGKAHGAFTNYLLLGLNGAGDTNNDGTLTYQELYGYLRDKTQQYGHTPQVKTARGMDDPVFDLPSRLVERPRESDPPAEVRLKLEGVGGGIAERIWHIPNLRLVQEAADLTVFPSGRGYQVALGNGDMLAEPESDAALLELLARYPRARQLVALKNPWQGFNVRLQFRPEPGRTLFFDREKVSYRIVSERDASILFIDVDSAGNVSVLIPDGASPSRLRAGVPLDLKDHVEVTPPFGVDNFKVFAFPGQVPELKRFAGKVMAAGDPDYQALVALIKSQTGWSEATLPFVTKPSMNGRPPAQ